MKRNSLRWRLPVSYAVVALLAAVALGSVMLLVLKSYYTNQELEYLHGNATALRPLIEQILQSKLPSSSLQDQIKGLSFLSQTRIRLLDTNGNILADSGVPESNQVVAVSGGAPFKGDVMFSVPVNPPKAAEDPLFIYRNDKSALLPSMVPFEGQMPPSKTGDIVVAISASPYGYGFVARKESDTEHRSSQTVSVPLISSDGRQLGSLEFAQGPSYGADIIASVRNAWLLASIFAIAIAAFTGWLMSRRVTQPVLVLEDATRQMEQGNLSVRVGLQNEKQQEFLSLANSFNGMAERVEETVSTLRAFIADAAHELHTPLTALQANIELARDEDSASARTRYLSRAQEQGHRLETLVKSLLDLSRIEATESVANFELIDLAKLVRELGEQFASHAEQTERMFTMQVPEEVIQIRGHETQLRQVVINLLENAFKFTPEGGTIDLSLEHRENEAVLTVSDSGIGIPPEDIPQLFKRFHRARNASGYSGNGLGLAIVDAIVRSHRGSVVVQSKEKQGTVVSAEFPFSKDG